MAVVNFASVTIDSVSRTAIPAPADGSVATLRNADLVNDATLYGASTGGTGITLTGGQSRTFRPQSVRELSWRRDDTIVWAQSAAGTGPIEVEMLR